MTVLVEDDPSIRKLVEYALSSNSIPVVSFASGEDAFSSLPDKVDLFLLDIMLPGMDGIEILHRIRKDDKLKNTPVIMLTAKDSEYDRAKGLDEGADDYIRKPFSIMELITRVKAVLRRTEPEIVKKIKMDNIVLDDERHEVTVNRNVIDLTFKEYELLKLLMQNAGIVMSRDVIMERVWDTGFEGETRTVDMHIKTLRKKLGESGNLIKTVRNVGYVME